MANYIEVKIQVGSVAEKDLLIAVLVEEGFEGFEESEDSLLAFVAETAFNHQSLEVLMQRMQAEYTVVTIRQQNWNELWESNFEPVQVGKFCHIRAQFHPPAQEEVAYEIVITPKMSFGTGHHATTYMMIETMMGIDLEGKTVLDFGTGTGVLAILAEKSGARKVDAIDLDEWSITNAQENFGINQVQRIFLHQTDAIRMPDLYDVILANINKNVLLENMHSIRSHLAADGVVVLSGLLKSDCNDMVEAAAAAGFALAGLQERGGWIALKLAPRQY